jgi:hypothetical protein
MRSNPTAAYDKAARKDGFRLQKNSSAVKQQQKNAALLCPSRAESKKDHSAIRRARSWRMSGTFAVGKVLAPRLDW